MRAQNKEELSLPIEFSPSNRVDSRRAFLEHLRRFTRQDRDVDWTSAPETFAETYGQGADDATANALRGAMESCFDRGDIRVERLPDGSSNRLIAVKPKAKASRRTTTRKPVAHCGTRTKPSDYVPVRTPLVARGRSNSRRTRHI